MKFLIQKINNEIWHDFSFHLIQSIHYKNWIDSNSKIRLRYLNYDTVIPDLDPFKPEYIKYIPIGSVEFVTKYLQYFYGLTPKPRNVPECLFDFAGRYIKNCDSSFNVKNLDVSGEYFIKSNDKIKEYDPYVIDTHKKYNVLPNGNFQISEKVTFQSEWRAFVYENKLVGLQNYIGNFTHFPNVKRINQIIKKFTDNGAPIAYTLDVGDTFDTMIVEIHDFFGCGLYGFADYRILPNMFYRWFTEYLQNNLK